jgi:hypothetical protein
MRNRKFEARRSICERTEIEADTKVKEIGRRHFPSDSQARIRGQAHLKAISEHQATEVQVYAIQKKRVARLLRPKNFIRPIRYPVEQRYIFDTEH